MVGKWRSPLGAWVFLLKLHHGGGVNLLPSGTLHFQIHPCTKQCHCCLNQTIRSFLHSAFCCWIIWFNPAAYCAEDDCSKNWFSITWTERLFQKLTQYYMDWKAFAKIIKFKHAQMHWKRFNKCTTSRTLPPPSPTLHLPVPFDVARHCFSIVSDFFYTYDFCHCIVLHCLPRSLLGGSEMLLVQSGSSMVSRSLMLLAMIWSRKMWNEI